MGHTDCDNHCTPITTGQLKSFSKTVIICYIEFGKFAEKKTIDRGRKKKRVIKIGKSFQTEKPTYLDEISLTALSFNVLVDLNDLKYAKFYINLTYLQELFNNIQYTEKILDKIVKPHQ